MLGAPEYYPSALIHCLEWQEQCLVQGQKQEAVLSVRCTRGRET